jgi:hypothetical protein
VPAVLGCSSICTLLAGPTHHEFPSVRPEIIWSSLLAIVGSVVLVAILGVIASRNERHLGRWAYYVGGGLTCVVIVGLSFRVALFLTAYSRVGSWLFGGLAGGAIYIVVTVVIAAISYLAFAAAVTQEMRDVANWSSYRTSLLFGFFLTALAILVALGMAWHQIATHG